MGCHSFISHSSSSPQTGYSRQTPIRRDNNNHTINPVHTPNVQAAQPYGGSTLRLGVSMKKIVLDLRK